MTQSILSTGLFSDREPSAETRESELFQFSNHLSLVTPIVELQQGSIVHKSATGIFAVFSDPVRAVLCAVKIQKAHHNWKEGPTPPRIRVVVLTGTDLSPQSTTLAKFLTHAGNGEILICPETATHWKEDGNRKIQGRSLSGSQDTGFVVLWDAPSREPKRLVRRRGWLFIMMVALPSLLIMLYSMMELPEALPPFQTHTLFWGPLWNSSGNLDCPVDHPTGWTVIEDPDFSRHDILQVPDRRRIRLTGFIRPGENGHEAVLDRIDASCGRHEIRIVSPCLKTDACACFASMVADVLASPTKPDGDKP